MPAGQLKRRNITAQRWGLVLLVLNLIGAVIYVVRASNGWVIPEERGLNSVTGEPFVWFVSILPVCVLFFVLNLTWGVLILVRKQWRSGLYWLSIIPIWLVALVVDFTHH